MIDSLPDLSYVMKYMDENDIKDKLFKESVSTVKELIDYDSRYMNILNDLVARYL